jgi:hypothetical protein
MARKTTRRRGVGGKRDDTWIVKEDEFHPDPRVAAREADKNARASAIRNLKQDHERLVARLNGSATTNAMPGSEVAAGIAELDRIADEIRRVEREAREAEEAAAA